MKRAALIWILVLLLFSGCSSSEVLSKENSASSFSMVYRNYTATESTSITVNDSATVTLTGQLKTQSGAATVVISNSAGEPVQSSEDTKNNFSFRVVLTGPDTYTISVICNKHTGSFSFQWETTGAQN